MSYSDESTRVGSPGYRWIDTATMNTTAAMAPSAPQRGRGILPEVLPTMCSASAPRPSRTTLRSRVERHIAPEERSGHGFGAPSDMPEVMVVDVPRT